uniref:Uncharacterized protein n=1 Tax=Sphaerodactylus townsendi TaxID=933632 RepID=A0ACB8EAY7_9SAUR
MEYHEVSRLPWSVVSVAVSFMWTGNGKAAGLSCKPDSALEAALWGFLPAGLFYLPINRSAPFPPRVQDHTKQKSLIFIADYRPERKARIAALGPSSLWLASRGRASPSGPTFQLAQKAELPSAEADPFPN